MSAERAPRALRLAEVDEVEVTVEKLVAGGEGLARWEGIPIFVPRSAPGDRARVRIVERRPDYGRAEILELLAPGPGRREPPCPYFADCGGCDLQHLEDRLQVRLKAEAVWETLLRIGGVALPADTEVIAGSMWGYRLRTQLHVERQGEEVRVGYFARGSQRLVPVQACPILVPALEEQLPALPSSLGAATPRRLDLLAGDGGQWTVAPMVEGLPHDAIAVRAGEESYELDARCFFQAHAELAGVLAEKAVGPWEGERAVDLYAGVGLLSLPLARRYRQVLAVEGDRIAARYARRNARHQRLTHLEVENLAVESWVAGLPAELDRVVVDPPRGGLAAPVRAALLARPPRRLTYVSCHPATLARDLKALAGAFRLESAALFDLFPQSGHMETLVQLVRTDQPAA